MTVSLFQFIPARRVAGCAAACAAFASSAALAQSGAGPIGTDPLTPPPIYRIVGKPEISTLYADGSQIEVQTEEVWRYMCGSDMTGLTAADLQAIAEAHHAAFSNGPAVIVDRGVRGGVINVIFEADASVPSAALTALATAEAYIETLFSDPITVKVTVSFANLGSGVLGATSVTYVNSVSWPISRDGLALGMDSNDSLQAILPAGSTIPVRYNGASSTVTNETNIDWSKAAYRSTVGTTTGNSGSTTWNSIFPWDYDPSNGVSGGQYSFIDVAIHECGHAMGFVSGADGFSGGDMEALDIFRFQRTDGTGDYNPDTTGEFTTASRLVSYNSPNDDHNTDFISVEYRMSDGSPYQASHWREGSGIGLMDPALAAGETHYPNFFSTADIAAFDAIGYDNPPCVAGDILTQPQSQNACLNDNVVLIVSTNASSPSYQWRKDFVNLTNDGHISGATSPTLTINSAQLDDTGAYDCLITNGVTGCVVFSDTAQVTVSLCGGITELVRNDTVPTSGVDLGVFQRNVTHFTFDLTMDTTVLPSDWTGSDLSVDVFEPSLGRIWHATDEFNFGGVPGNLNVPFLDAASTDTRAYDTFCTPPGFPFFTPPQIAAPGGIVSDDLRIRGISGQGLEIPLTWFDTTPNLGGDNFVGARLSFELYAGGDLSTTPGGTPFATIFGRTSMADLPGGDPYTFNLYAVTSPSCPWDLDQDGTIELDDLSVVLVNFGTTSGAGPEDGDFDGDGDVDLDDLSELLVRFGQPCP